MEAKPDLQKSITLSPLSTACTSRKFSLQTNTAMLENSISTFELPNTIGLPWVSITKPKLSYFFRLLNILNQLQNQFIHVYPVQENSTYLTVGENARIKIGATLHVRERKRDPGF